MNFSERLKMVRGDIHQKRFAEMVNVHVNTLGRWERGEQYPSQPDICKILQICPQVNPTWFLTGEGPQYTADTLPQKDAKPLCQCGTNNGSVIGTDDGSTMIPQWRNPDPEMFDYVPMAETQLSAGGGAFVISEEIEGYYAFRKNWLSRVASSTRNLVLMRVVGDSMSPTIQDADTVMIDTGKKSIKEGMLYAIRFDSTVMVKRLAFRPSGRIMIISDNRQEFDSFEVEIKELNILGQIIFFCRTFVPD